MVVDQILKCSAKWCLPRGLKKRLLHLFKPTEKDPARTGAFCYLRVRCLNSHRDRSCNFRHQELLSHVAALLNSDYLTHQLSSDSLKDRYSLRNIVNRFTVHRSIAINMGAAVAGVSQAEVIATIHSVIASPPKQSIIAGVAE